MKRTFWQEVVRLGGFVLTGSIIGWFMLLVVYMLPIELMEKNVQKAREELIDLGPSPLLLWDNATTRLDIYTDTIMLNEAIYDGNEGIMEKAVAIYRYDYEGKTPFESLLAYLSGDGGGEKTEYARYWHGYLIFLKPLLLIGTYDNIKCLNLFVQLSLISVIVIEMTKRQLTHYIGCFILGIYALMPVSVAMCLQYATVLNMTLIAIVTLLKYYEKIMHNNAMSFFYTGIGMTVCYFDFLTYPLVALGFVLVIHSMVEKSNISIKMYLHNTLMRILYWSFGYVGLWGMKWVFASIFMKENIIKEGILQIIYRASTGVSEIGIMEEISRFQTMLLNIKTIATPTLLFALSGFTCFMLILYIRRRKWSLNMPKEVARLMIAVLPFIWVAATANHAYIHYWMVYREFSITIFSLTCIITSIVWN